MAKDERDTLESLAEHARIKADQHLNTAINWANMGGNASAEEDLVKAGGYLRVRDHLLELLK